MIPKSVNKACMPIRSFSKWRSVAVQVERSCPRRGLLTRAKRGTITWWRKVRRAGMVRAGRRHRVAARPAAFVDQAFAAQFAEVVGSLAHGVGGMPCHGVDLAGEVSATLKPPSAADRASTAARAARICDLFRSIPPTRVAPIQ